MPNLGVIPVIVGVLNITPDSFSDGGMFLDPQTAAVTATRMLTEGAQLVELGGDSTRPGSVCCGAKAEWQRIQPVLKLVAGRVRFGVDTHHAVVATDAIAQGAAYINDVSAGGDPRLLEAVAASGVRLALMHSRCSAPHLFDLNPEGDLIASIRSFLEQRIELAGRAGIDRERLILDPGMGAFLSADPRKSFELLERFAELESLGCDLMLGVSRKGFLKSEGERVVSDRDAASAQIAQRVCAGLNQGRRLYIRVHNVPLHSEVLKSLITRPG